MELAQGQESYNTTCSIYVNNTLSSHKIVTNQSFYWDIYNAYLCRGVNAEYMLTGMISSFEFFAGGIASYIPDGMVYSQLIRNLDSTAAGCLRMVGISNTHQRCLLCEELYYLKEGTCVLKCSPGYDSFSETRTCFKCLEDAPNVLDLFNKIIDFY